MAGYQTQSRATYFRHEAECEESLVEYAEQLTKDAGNDFCGNVAIDCRWSTPVRGIHRTVSTVDTVNHKIVEFATINKKGKNRPTGNYDESSNNMETYGTSMFIQQMKEHEIFNDINKITKDRDNKSGKLLDDIGASDLIVSNPGHYRKNFEKAFNQMVQENRNFSYYNDEGELKKINHPFYGMKTHIIKWLNTCLKEYDQDTRVQCGFHVSRTFWEIIQTVTI